MDCELILNCVSPLSRDYLSKLPHHVVPSMNLHRVLPYEEESSGSVSSLFFKSPPFSSSLPVPFTPLIKASRQALNGFDTTTSLIQEKLKWQLKKEKILKAVRKDQKNISEKVIKQAVRSSEDTPTVVPQGIALLAQHLDKDPDPHFSGVSNWYYSGGTLATLEHNQDHYLLHATHSKLDYSRIVRGRKCESSTLDLGADPIHQVITNSSGAAVRQKSQVSLFSRNISDEDKFELKSILTISNKSHIFSTVALRDDSFSKFCTLSNNGVLKMWDIQHADRYRCKVEIKPGEGVTVSDDWSSLQYMDHRTLLLADRCCIHLLDTRAGMQERQLAWCPRKLTELCEEQSCVVRSQVRENAVYTLTTHQALCLDLRFGFCQRWSHLMTAPPHLGFARSLGTQEEVLCLGSQLLSDCVYIVNTWGAESHSVYRPTGLPSPAQGLHLARQKGLCLDHTLTQRCIQSMIGLTWLPAVDGELHIVRQSATADMFTQQLMNGDQSVHELTEEQLTAYSDWASPTVSLHRDSTALTVTQVANFTPIFKAVTNINIPTEKTEEKDSWRPEATSWQLSKKYLEECVDLLAGRLLAVWEVEEDDEWAGEFDAVGESLAEQDPSEKVLNWLDGNTTGDNRNVTDISNLKPTVASTPFLPAATGQDFISSSEPSPWMSQPSQLLPQMHHRSPSPSPSRHLRSPLFSLCSETKIRKRQIEFTDSVLITPTKPSTSVKKPQSSVKKKFTPGF